MPSFVNKLDNLNIHRNQRTLMELQKKLTEDDWERITGNDKNGEIRRLYTQIDSFRHSLTLFITSSLSYL